MDGKKIAYGIIITLGSIVVLWYGKSLILPFVVSVLLWILIKEIRNLFKRIPFVKEKIPNSVLNMLGFIIIFVVSGAIVKILSVNIQSLSASMPAYEQNVREITLAINAYFNIDIMTILRDLLGDYDYSNVLSKVFNSLSDIFNQALIIIIYTVFLLLEEKFFGLKLDAIYTKSKDNKEVRELLRKINISIGKYLSIKTIVSLITGAASYIVLLIVGLDAPLFWAFLIFLMNYIPNIGSIVATIFPSLFAVLQFGELMPGVWVMLTVGSIQMIVGNYIDPKLTGNSLNVSPLVVIIGLAFWGALWGILGMILSVPITVIFIIIFSEIPAMRPMAILMSQTGLGEKKEK